jgi:glutamate---cysteine ligase / carboxylate-amine ligase
MTVLRAFAGYGIELEYMIVDRETLMVRPLADRLLRDESGRVVNELPRDGMGWSNELTLHLVEIKNAEPQPLQQSLARAFQAEIREIARRLEPMGACLMPAAMHPWMDPARETHLWPHANAEIYLAYDHVFGCRQHGFANLQSMHLNLPFADDEEFARLHAAVRLVLPILPALAASSPIADGHPTGYMDTRLQAYRSHQAKVPTSMGQLVPDTVSSQADYRQRILGPMYRQMSALDPAGILCHEWLNARGAIPRFERMALEIRLIDMQEHPLADLAVAAAVSAVVRRLYHEQSAGLAGQQAYPVEPLAGLLETCIRHADQAAIADPGYLRLLGFPGASCRAGELWHWLIEEWWKHEPDQQAAWGEPLAVILKHGPLARRILKAVDTTDPHARLEAVYRALCDCLINQAPFLGAD